jgi:hypothetical protein
MTKQVLDNTGNVGSGADAVAPIVDLGAGAAGVSRVANAQAWSFLGKQIASGLKTIGRIGTGASLLGVGADLLNGDGTSALYDGLDYFVYSKVAEVGADGAIESAGATAALSAATLAAYYNAGGSRGLVQGVICP